MYPLMVELRGMSMSGEELTEGGHPLALIVLSITLTKHLTRLSLRLTPGFVRSLEGDCCLGGADLPPTSAGSRPSVHGWWAAPAGPVLLPLG